MLTLMFYYLIDSIVSLLIFRVYAILFLFWNHSQTDCHARWKNNYTETKLTHGEQGHFQLSDLALHEFSQLSG